jgi:hypothetical protein
VAKAVFAVVTEPNLVVRDPLDELAVTVPLIAGRDAIVTLFEIDAVTEPIWAVPATRAGSVVSDTGCVPWKNVPLTGTVPLMLAVTLPICAVPAPMVTVPPPIVTTPMRFVPVGRAEPMVTELLILALKISDGVFPI